MPQANDRGAYSGRKAHEYVNLSTASDWYETPTWARVSRVEDVDLPDERSTSEFKLKDREFDYSVSGTRATSIAFKYRKKRGDDPVFDELKAAYEDQELCVDYAATDRDITIVGAKGFRGPYIVTKFNESRPHGGVVEVDVELKLADAEREDLPANPGEFVVWDREAIETTS